MTVCFNRFNLRVSAILAFSIWILVNNLSAQKYKNQEIFPVDDITFKSSGWYAGAGATYTFALPATKTLTFPVPEDSTLRSADATVYGRFGFLAEGGRFTMTVSRLIPYIDYGVRIKMIGGREDMSSVYVVNDNSDTIIYNNSAGFYHYYGGLHFNANNVIRISEYGFIQNTAGISVDYRFASVETGISPPFNTNAELSDEKFSGQLVYKLGYGFRLDNKHFMTFTFETPVLSLYKWDNGKSTVAMFNSRYRPILFTVRVLFLNSAKGPDCNKPAPIDMDAKRKRKKERLF